ncbi:MAG: esterase-like activity of phytase family protein, partial [Pseudomonadota bacterium]
MKNKSNITLLSTSLFFALINAPQASDTPVQEYRQADHFLTGWAALSSSTRTSGPSSGHFIEGLKGVKTPFVDYQVIPGWSALLNNADGTYLAMPDNGFGAKSNSSDFVLGYYIIQPNFKTQSDGTTQPGKIKNQKFIPFNDSKGFLNNKKGIDFKITADYRFYPSINDNKILESEFPVDSRIKKNRWLTGFDFDVESAARATDGALWVGEEFGPYLLKFDEATGTLLQEPIPHPSLKSPFNQEVMRGKAVATLGASKGFESLATNSDGTRLYVVPEAAPIATSLQPIPGDERVLEIYEFNPKTSSYTGRSFKYQKDGDSIKNQVVIGDMINLGKDRFVLIERDSQSGVNAVIKRLYTIELSDINTKGILNKKLLLDLLKINDPLDIGGPLPRVAPQLFNLPFDSIENVVVL